MTKFMTHFPALLLAALPLALGAPGAVAQSASNGEAETATETPQVADELSMGEDVDSTPKPGETYIKEEVGDWALRCIVVEDGEDPCQMYQLMADEAGAPIAEYTLFRLPEGSDAAAGATIVVPLETALQQQLSIQVDSGTTKRYPYAFCNQVGCYARIGLTAEDVAAYKRGSEAVLSIVPAAAPDRQISVKLSLDGFTAAFDKASLLDR